RPGDELRAVVHADREPPGHVVLEVRRLAAFGLGERLHVVRPAPAGLEHEPADLAAADLDDLGPAARKFAQLVRMLESLVLTLAHGFPPSFWRSRRDGAGTSRGSLG